MKKNSLQIDVKGEVSKNPTLMECNMWFDNHIYKVFIFESTYHELINEGFFIRDGLKPDSAGMINTSKVYTSKE